MNEPSGPHGFYDGPVKELAARHLGLIKAIFFLLLVSLPGFLTCMYVRYDLCRITVMRQYPAGFESFYPYAQKPAREEKEWTSAHLLWSGDKLIEASVAGFPVTLSSCQSVSFSALLLAWAFPLMGVGLLLFRFFRLTKLLYPQLALYFTLLVLVPFMNLIAIMLLLRSALRQMRDRGLRVGMFGIDPARFG